MAYDALEAVKHRNDFYRDGYHKVVIALLVSLVVIVGLVAAIIFIAAQKPSPTYFAATDSGRIIPLIPLDRPNLTSKAVLQWASDAVVSVNSYNFVNYRDALQASQKYFTNAGWRSFLNALSESKNLDLIKEKKMVVSSVLRGAPVVTNEYVVNGRYTWRIQMPVLVTYQSGSDQVDQRYLVLLKVERVSTLDNVYGIGISEYVAEQQ